MCQKDVQTVTIFVHFYAAGYPGTVRMQNMCQKDVHFGTHIFYRSERLKGDVSPAQIQTAGSKRDTDLAAAGEGEPRMSQPWGAEETPVWQRNGNTKHTQSSPIKRW